MMDSRSLLPPLHISLLNDVPGVDKDSENNSVEKRIAFSVRYLHDFELLTDRKLSRSNIRIYKSEEKAPSLTYAFTGEESDVDSEKAVDFLVFICCNSANQRERDKVFVLSTNRSYKSIRNVCSHQFPLQFSRYCTHLDYRIQHLTKSHLFAPVSESSLSLKKQSPDKLDQSEVVCREVTAIFHSFPGIEGTDVKVEFKEKGVVIYRHLQMMQYVTIAEDLMNSITNLPPCWMPGIPENGLATIYDGPALVRLNTVISNFIACNAHQDWSFNIALSERWYRKASEFRIYYYGGKRGSYPLAHTVQSTPLLLQDVMYIGTACDIFRGKVCVEYRTKSDRWYGFPLIDCLEGWIRDPNGNVYYKVGTSWYQVDNDHVAWVDKILKGILDQPATLLRPGDQGYLHLPWRQETKENDYNRLYLQLNKEISPQWFDGNLKRCWSFELFDILLVEKNDVYLYHVKKEFGTHAKEAGAQLVSSAQAIHSCRSKSSDHPDRIALARYCANAAGVHQTTLLDALLSKNLHFVLAFRFSENPRQKILSSGSISAKHEMIRTKENIESLNSGFQFHICPIQLEQAAVLLHTFQSKELHTIQVMQQGGSYFVNGFPAIFCNDYYRWFHQTLQSHYACHKQGNLFKFVEGNWKQIN